MDARYKVSFFDVEHQLSRTLEVRAASPESAAEIALQKLLAKDKLVADFGDSIRVAEVTCTQHSLSLSAVADRLGIQRRAA